MTFLTYWDRESLIGYSHGNLVIGIIASGKKIKNITQRSTYILIRYIPVNIQSSIREASGDNNKYI